MKARFNVGDSVRSIGTTKDEVSNGENFVTLMRGTEGKILAIKENKAYVKFRFVYTVDFQGVKLFVRQGLLRKIK